MADDESTERHSGSPCAGLSESEAWDRAEHLRGTLLASDRLLDHARELAHAHGEPGKHRIAPLRKRFAEVKKELGAAYAVLARDVRAVREPSPCEEWLLDNAHVVEEQVREVETDLPWGYLVKLPRLRKGAMRGYPRVYALCLDFLRHSDARVDPEILVEYVKAYQSVHVLTIGELWAIPIMLRLGLLMIVSMLATEAARDDHNQRARMWADRLHKQGDGQILQELDREHRTPGFLVELERLLREHETTFDAVLRWIREVASTHGASIEELSRRHHLRRAGDQLSVGNAITSMRTISAYKWSRFFQAISAVEAVLVQDPNGAYAASDDESRDRCRHEVEKIARRSPINEPSVAKLALALAQGETEREKPNPARAHVGYYLLDQGRVELERVCGCKPALSWRARRFVERYAAPIYLGAIAGVSALLAALVWHGLTRFGAGEVTRALITLLALLPMSEVALALVNSVAMLALPPRLLARFAFEGGIPEADRTLVVVPCLFDGEDTVRQLLAHLEIRALANPDPFLSFALLSDFVDADVEAREQDRELIELARAGIAELNERHTTDEEQPRFMLLHRRRVYNRSERCFMGWERKRGKLEELNALLRGSRETSFEVVTAPRAMLQSVRYVITLDADTELPRGSARKLVATISHPLNRAQLVANKVVRGYTILQPRVGTTPSSTRRSRFARLMAGPLGIDPYTTAVSDVYQDLFGEGSYTGKGIYDVDAFTRALAGRVRENTVLSHDLLEGLLSRAALVSDIELFDDQPQAYGVYARRQHRWIRGDWQLIPWIFARGFSAVGRFKLIDNLRRSLVAPALIGALSLAMLAVPRAAAHAVGLVICALLGPWLLRVLAGIARSVAVPSARTPFQSLFGDFVPSLKQAGLQATFLVDQALLSADAIARTLYRMLISRRQLLQWQTSSQVQRMFARRGSPLDVRLGAAAVLAVCLTLAIAIAQPSTAMFVLPVGVLWALAPVIAVLLSGPVEHLDYAAGLSAEDRRELRTVARRTWLFFETFVTQDDNFLPPDNYQEDPRGVVAHRTSPTNIGLYLLSSLAARDFGYVTLHELVTRVGQTLQTMGRLEQREGHILNWYETTTLKPLEPKYVSTVDSGNLAAYLWTLKSGFDELITGPVHAPQLLSGLADTLRLADDPSEIEALIERVESAERSCAISPSGTLSALCELRALMLAHGATSQSSAWVLRGLQALDAAIAEQSALTAFQELLPLTPPQLLQQPWGDRFSPIWQVLEAAHSLERVAALDDQVGAPLERMIEELRVAGDDEAREYLLKLCEHVELAQSKASALVEGLIREGARAQELANQMNFGFLFDRDRELFSIGYNLGAAKLDGSYYDLLASEARLASLFAIAKGEVPERHWFRLGRTRASVGHRHALLAWSGSMFEYLMPLLVTKDPADTLLHETCESAVLVQRDHGREHDVPWGVSESAYNVMDLSMTYQYRAFGVQSLGLKAGLADDLVVAPYATVLAALVRPDLAVPNLRALAKEGMLGPFGYYEAIDYTKTRVPPKRRGIAVKAYFAHHQGMSLVALDNVLHGAPMQRRFHGHRAIQATELLLDERVPHTTAVVYERVLRSPAPIASESELSAVEHVGLTSLAQPRVHLLGHGELATLVTSVGTGFTIWHERDIHRFREDPQLEPSGIFVYVRDLGASGADPAVWSAAYEPTRVAPTSYDAAFAPHRVDIHRRDGAIETNLHITVSPEHPADVRRITLINHGTEPRDIEVTSYTEIVLDQRAADRAHRAFSNMFLQSEALEDRGALLAHRRLRKNGELQPWLTQQLTPESGEWRDFQYETSRAAFLGRGRGVDAPRALDPGARLSCKANDTLDTAFALRRTVTLAPGARASIVLTTALAQDESSVRDLAQAFSAPSTIDRTFELAWADAAVELKHLGISAVQSHRFQRLLSAILFPQPGYRADLQVESVHGEGKRVLWSQGLSDDLPIVIVRIDQNELGDVCRELLLAHEFFRLNNLKLELLLLNEEPAGYLSPVQDSALSLVHARLAHGQLDQRGGIFVRRASHLTPHERTLLLAAGRVVLTVSQGSLARQLRRAADRAPALSALMPSTPRAPSTPRSIARPALQLDNGLGGFSEDGREYVMLLDAQHKAPAPWSNVIANALFGCVVTERGGGFTWSQSSQRHRLTAWSNDAVRDPLGEVIYLRDDEDGSVWSATPAPCSERERFTVRHGQGYSAFAHTREDGSGAALEHELTLFVDVEAPVKLLRLKLHNRGKRARTLSVYGCVDLVLGSHRDLSRSTICTQWLPAERALIASNAFSAFPGRYAFFASTDAVRSATADRLELYGADGTSAWPRGLRQLTFSGRAGFGLDPCAALQVSIELPPGGQHELAFVLGEGETLEHAHALARSFATHKAVKESFARVQRVWDEQLGRVELHTPDRQLDLLVNRFLPYQTLACRHWARSAFYQSGGAFGFRDQLQDVLALLHMRPDLTREHLLRAAARQFVEGDVQHWWHPETGEGVRTRCSDDLIWLPFAVNEYVRVTGDRAVLDEQVPFLQERVLEDKDHDIYSAPRVAPELGTLYEHCLRALACGTTFGERGLPLMRGGDWNDGMDRVGVQGRGESVWLGFFLVRVLRDFAELVSERGERARAAELQRDSDRYAKALEEHAWDGAWYRRAFCDDGTVLGSAQSEECRIDAIAQAWAVLSGSADRERAAQALQEAEQQLVQGDIMMLLTPPFTGAVADPGYIRGYPPGIRENGGQYTHGVLWTAQALAQSGEADRAYALLSMLSPIHHTRSLQAIARYQIEPYAIAADVYSSPAMFGRGGWSWYTGAAGWMYRIALEHIFGFAVRAGTIRIAPCLPSHIDRYRIVYRPYGSAQVVIEIDVERDESLHAQIATLDGRNVPASAIPIPQEVGTHHIRVRLAGAITRAAALRAPHMPPIQDTPRNSSRDRSA